MTADKKQKKSSKNIESKNNHRSNPHTRGWIKAKANSKTKSNAKAGAVAAEDIAQAFPSIRLPIKPPFPPQEAKSVSEVPVEPGWLYEPKWDGFRCLAFRSGKKVLLQSKSGQPLGRYFPELMDALAKLPK